MGTKTFFAAMIAFLSVIVNCPFAIAQNNDPIVLMQTTKGPLYIRVYVSGAPYTARNFLDLVDRGFYNGLRFHRVENWCIQGGDPNGNGSGDFINPETGRPRLLRLECNRNLRHVPGCVAMARKSNDVNSASCQFYIMKCTMPQLDGQYAVFGQVLKGKSTVFSIVPGDRILSAEIYHDDGASNTSASGTPPPQGQKGQQQVAPKGESGF